MCFELFYFARVCIFVYRVKYINFFFSHSLFSSFIQLPLIAYDCALVRIWIGNKFLWQKKERKKANETDANTQEMWIRMRYNGRKRNSFVHLSVDSKCDKVEHTLSHSLSRWTVLVLIFFFGRLLLTLRWMMLFCLVSNVFLMKSILNGCWFCKD